MNLFSSCVAKHSYSLPGRVPAFGRLAQIPFIFSSWNTSLTKEMSVIMSDFEEMGTSAFYLRLCSPFRVVSCLLWALSGSRLATAIFFWLLKATVKELRW